MSPAVNCNKTQLALNLAWLYTHRVYLHQDGNTVSECTECM